MKLNKAQQEVIDEMLLSLITMTALCKLKYGSLDKLVYPEILKAEKIIGEVIGMKNEGA